MDLGPQTVEIHLHLLFLLLLYLLSVLALLQEFRDVLHDMRELFLIVIISRLA